MKIFLVEKFRSADNHPVIAEHQSAQCRRQRNREDVATVELRVMVVASLCGWDDGCHGWVYLLRMGLHCLTGGLAEQFEFLYIVRCMIGMKQIMLPDFRFGIAGFMSPRQVRLGLAVY